VVGKFNDGAMNQYWTCFPKPGDPYKVTAFLYVVIKSFRCMIREGIPRLESGAAASLLGQIFK